jgi:fructose-specific phosphotransferase system IIA component
MTTIISLLNEEHVFSDLKADTKKQVLSTMIASFREDVEAGELEAIKEAVFERENIMSTGVGKGLAIPHGKADGINENYAAFALLQSPIEYKAIDGEPVTMVFLLVGPQASNNLHIKMLSRISRLMNNNSFREKLLECNSPKEIVEVFKKEEELYFGN